MSEKATIGIPPSWTSIPLGDALDSLMDYRGRTPKKLGMDWGGSIPALSALNVRHGQIDLERTNHFGSEALFDVWMTKGPTRKGDVLITSEAPLGNIAQVPDDRKYILSQRVMLLRPHAWLLDSTFLALQMSAPEFQAQLAANDSGTTVRGIQQQKLVRIPAKVPPLAEQKRIVAKIEELFSELEAGEESLRVARRQLGIYRQSLLKQAFEGHLTAKWRTQNPAQLESPAQLLAHIQSVATSSGRSRSKQAGEGSDEVTATIDADLPKCWVNARLREIGSTTTGNTPPTSDESNYGVEVPFVKPPDLTNHPVNKTHAYLSQQGADRSRVLPKHSVLVTCIGNLGRVGINRVPVAFNQQINAVVPHSAVDPFFLFYAAQSPEFRHQLESMASATTISIVNKSNFEKITVPLCSLPEQQEIVRLLDEQFEVIERNEREIDGALRQSEALRQAILQKAFTGRLVPQSLTDEPASALLARLRVLSPAR